MFGGNGVFLSFDRTGQNDQARHQIGSERMKTSAAQHKATVVNNLKENQHEQSRLYVRT